MEETTQSESMDNGEAQPIDSSVSNEDHIKLGGGIELNGFSGVEKAHLVVVKKMVGNSAKEMTEKARGFEKVAVTVSKEGQDFKVNVELTASGNQMTANSTENNLFMALNGALKGVVDQL